MFSIPRYFQKSDCLFHFIRCNSFIINTNVTWYISLILDMYLYWLFFNYVIDIESIINKIQTGLSLNSNSCPKIHQPFSHSWHHSHGKRAAMGHHGLQALLKNGHSLSDFGGLNRHDNDRGQKHPNDFSDKRACRGHNSWDLQDLNVEWDTNKLNFTDVRTFFCTYYVRFFVSSMLSGIVSCKLARIVLLTNTIIYKLLITLYLKVTLCNKQMN